MKKVAVLRLRNPQNEILFLLRATKPYGWGLVGGEVDPIDNGSTRFAAARELEEETGILLSEAVLTYIGASKTSKGQEVDVYEAHYDPTYLGNPKIQLNKAEHLNYRWVKDDDNITQLGLSFAGTTLDFVQLGKPVHMPEALDKMSDRILVGMALTDIQTKTDNNEQESDSVPQV